MRDLPPQMQALVLEQHAQAFLALPQREWSHAGLLLDVDTADREATTAPPDTERLHAAPVGIVRLLT